jgi:hypothetical protein
VPQTTNLHQSRGDDVDRHLKASGKPTYRTKSARCQRLAAILVSPPLSRRPGVISAWNATGRLTGPAVGRRSSARNHALGLCADHALTEARFPRPQLAADHLAADTLTIACMPSPFRRKAAIAATALSNKARPPDLAASKRQMHRPAGVMGDIGALRHGKSGDCAPHPDATSATRPVCAVGHHPSSFLLPGVAHTESAPLPRWPEHRRKLAAA